MHICIDVDVKSCDNIMSRHIEQVIRSLPQLADARIDVQVDSPLEYLRLFCGDEGDWVVRGTLVSVLEIVKRLDDGWTISDILHYYPELDEDDINACREFGLRPQAGAGR